MPPKAAVPPPVVQAFDFPRAVQALGSADSAVVLQGLTALLGMTAAQLPQVRGREAHCKGGGSHAVKKPI